MPNNYFRFKQFAVRQEKTAMKVGTDGVLLGAWTDVANAKNILDIGTGTGLVALMLAQRCNAQIDAVEIDNDSASQAKENFENSRWSSRISIHHLPFQDFAKNSTQQYDLIVSNPPYFVKSLKSPELARSIARHNDQLPYSQLLEGISKLINETGRFAGIFPYVEGNIFVAEASTYNLYCSKRVNVFGKSNGNIKRVLLEFTKEKLPLIESNFTIRELNGDYSQDYITLTKDFYLAF